MSRNLYEILLSWYPFGRSGSDYQSGRQGQYVCGRIHSRHRGILPAYTCGKQRSGVQHTQRAENAARGCTCYRYCLCLVVFPPTQRRSLDSVLFLVADHCRRSRKSDRQAGLWNSDRHVRFQHFSSGIQCGGYRSNHRLRSVYPLCFDG